jgi:hypothetical protein
MKNVIKILGIIAGAVGAAAIITRKRADGTSMFDDISETGKNWGDKLVQYGTQLKDKLMPELKICTTAIIILTRMIRGFIPNHSPDFVLLFSLKAIREPRIAFLCT